jgi:hypothetical protein
MKRRLKHVIAGTVLTVCMGMTSAGETPGILGAIEYKAMSRQAMAQVVGQHGGSAGGGGVDSWRTTRAPGTSPELQAGGGAIGSGGEM